MQKYIDIYYTYMCVTNIYYIDRSVCNKYINIYYMEYVYLHLISYRDLYATM